MIDSSIINFIVFEKYPVKGTLSVANTNSIFYLGYPEAVRASGKRMLFTVHLCFLIQALEHSHFPILSIEYGVGGYYMLNC